MVRAVYHIHRELPLEASKIYGGVKEGHREPQLDRIDTRGANTTPRRDCADRLLDDARSLSEVPGEMHPGRTLDLSAGHFR